MKQTVRTRFAPSPTGFMHVGNLRSALYAYLFARANKGDFVLRIEDTDQKRLVQGATEVVYKTLKTAQINHDEGPDVGGAFGPYVQSERKPMYKKYAEELVQRGHAYYCFCEPGAHRVENTDQQEGDVVIGYDRTCRNLSEEQIKANLDAGMPYVIRQKMPLSGTTSYDDLVFGTITVKNEIYEDQVLLKRDGLPTYNFANVVDDHTMNITHVLRGSEYLPSTPKYVLLYQGFGWQAPQTAHLPLIMGQDAEGNVSKLSKRFGATSFEELQAQGFLPEAIINYIALLGWSPKSEQELFTMQELEQIFDIKDVSKSPAIFDYKKLRWMNTEYIKKLSDESLIALLTPFATNLPTELQDKWNFIATSNRERIEVLADIDTLILDMITRFDYDAELLTHKKNKLTLEGAQEMLLQTKQELQQITTWTHQELHDTLVAMKDKYNKKLGYIMWPLRIALTGRAMSPSGIDYLYCLGKKESFERIDLALQKLENALA